MICNTKKRKLNNIKLSRDEYDLLVVLSNEQITTYKEICKYVYGYYTEICLKHLKYNLETKGVKIQNITGVGFKLKTKILWI